MPAHDKNSQSNAQLLEKDPDIKQILIEIKLRLSSIEGCLKVNKEKIEAVEAKAEVTSTKLDKVAAELKVVTENYEALLSRISTLESENKERKADILILQINANDTQQRFRLQTVRFLNVKDEIKDADKAAKMLYNKFILPCLDEGEDPGVYAVVEYAHLLPPNPAAKKKYDGFCYILRFTTRFYKLRFFLQKKKIIDDVCGSDKVKVKIQHDYTWINRQALDRLHKIDAVKKVTVRGTRLLYKLDEDGAWTEVLNPFAKVLADMANI